MTFTVTPSNWAADTPRRKADYGCDRPCGSNGFSRLSSMFSSLVMFISYSFSKDRLWRRQIREVLFDSIDVASHR